MAVQFRRLFSSRRPAKTVSPASLTAAIKRSNGHQIYDGTITAYTAEGSHTSADMVLVPDP
jgi:hypothetical protein